MHIPNTLPFFTVSDMPQCQSKAPSALVGVEGDSVMALEPPSNSQRIEIRPAEIFVFPSARRLFLDACKQRLEP
jgi:hypothetical protein